MISTIHVKGIWSNMLNTSLQTLLSPLIAFAPSIPENLILDFTICFSTNIATSYFMIASEVLDISNFLTETNCSVGSCFMGSTKRTNIESYARPASSVLSSVKIETSLSLTVKIRFTTPSSNKRPLY